MRQFPGTGIDCELIRHSAAVKRRHRGPFSFLESRFVPDQTRLRRPRARASGRLRGNQQADHARRHLAREGDARLERPAALIVRRLRGERGAALCSDPRPRLRAGRPFRHLVSKTDH